MNEQTLDILIARTMQKIEHTQLDNNLTDAEYNYFLHSILHHISLSLYNSASKTMKKEIDGEVD